LLLLSLVPCRTQESEDDDVGKYPQFEYSMKEVRRAGEALAGDISWTPGRDAEIKETFKVANNWCDSHAFPMRKLRLELIARMGREDLPGITAARLKRMPSVRRKLRVQGWTLNQVQDLAGVRAIVTGIDAVKTLVASYAAVTKHDLYKTDDYIGHPKGDGYRCHHLMFKFKGEGESSVLNGRRMELQVRTRLQHSWATAVESVGTFRNENLKAGVGDSDWLRLFRLMSAEIATAEKCPEGGGLPTRSERIKEIKDLNSRLHAVNSLENWRHAVRFTDNYAQNPEYRAAYYLVTYNNVTMQVSVEPYSQIRAGTAAYRAAEEEASKSGGQVNMVLVETGKIESLKEAYPNYFGDVQVFTANLKALTAGGQAREYTMPPQYIAPRPPREAADMSWFRRTARRRD
jgi:hypothetical protein